MLQACLRGLAISPSGSSLWGTTPQSMPGETVQHWPSGASLQLNTDCSTFRRTGHYYSNPSNWMWRILMRTGALSGQDT